MDPVVRQVCIPPDSTIRHAADSIDRSEKGIALVVNGDGRLVDTITDGDIRRAMLAGVAMETSVAVIASAKARLGQGAPVTAPHGASRAELLELMRARAIRHVPLLDADGRVAGLATQDDLLPEDVLPLQAVVMAGGFGVRLRPLTDNLPKPMLPVDGKPLMERIIGQLRQTGVRQVHVATHYRPEKIVEYFGDGAAFGVEMRYVNEDRPLGTAGALGLMPAPATPTLVINGDIVTEMDFRAMWTFHREQGADMTVAVRRYDVKLPYGVIECDGPRVCRLTEKPRLNFFVNAGIYLLEPGVYRHVPAQQRFDMTDLIQRLVDLGRMVAGFPVREYWVDIGRPDDYERIQTESNQRRPRP